jgi:hypothetical protein
LKARYSLLILFALISITLGAQTEIIKDIDGNSYETIKIRDQVWMIENLKTTRLNDGTPIPLVQNSLVWKQTLNPAYCWYNNDEKVNKESFRALYNWYAVETGKLCPAGWHVPSDKVWLEKPTLPAGYRDENGYFMYLRDQSIYWTSTSFTVEEAYFQSVLSIGNRVNRDHSTKKYGHSVRCLKDNVP